MRLKDINPNSSSSNPATFFIYNDVLYFSAIADGVLGRQLWKTDGTEMGTQQILYNNVKSPISSATKFISFNNAVYFWGNYGKPGLWKFSSAAAGIAKVDEEFNITIFPNPSSAILNIIAPLKINKIAVYNAEGVLMRSYNENPQQINIENLQRGIYFLQITSQDKQIVKKIVKI